MNVSNLKRNERNFLIDQAGMPVFNNDIFNQLSLYDHMSQTTPALQYVDAQIAQAYVPFPSEARKYIDINCSRLLDDNASLANQDINVRNLYLSDVSSFLAMCNRICMNDNIKNQVLGDTFTTKNDDSENSKIPMYLCMEILQAKCLNHLNTPMTPLENFNLTPATEQEKTSTLGQEFTKVIENTKKLDYNKSYFGQDINDVTKNWLAACQVDPNGSVDLYAQCDDTQCLLFITQKVNGGNETVNSSPMFTIQKNIDSANIVKPGQDVFKDVTVVGDGQLTPNKESAVNLTPNINNNSSVTSAPIAPKTDTNAEKMAQLKKYRDELTAKMNEVTSLQNQISSLINSMLDAEAKTSDNEVKNMVA